MKAMAEPAVAPATDARAVGSEMAVAGSASVALAGAAVAARAGRVWVAAAQRWRQRWRRHRRRRRQQWRQRRRWWRGSCHQGAHRDCNGIQRARNGATGRSNERDTPTPLMPKVTARTARAVMSMMLYRAGVPGASGSVSSAANARISCSRGCLRLLVDLFVGLIVELDNPLDWRRGCGC